MRKNLHFLVVLFLYIAIGAFLGGGGCSDSGPGSGSGSGSDTGSISTTPFTWEAATPESQGMSLTKLEAMWSVLEARDTAAFVVIRNDKVVFEEYSGLGRHEKHFTASLAKSLVGSMSLMVAMQDGLISPDDFASYFVPQWASHSVKKTITIRQLATHTSGLADAAESSAFWDRLDVPNDPFTISRDAISVLYAPGSVLSYSNPGFAMLGYAITASLAGTADTDLRTLLANRIMEPIGVPESEWDCGYTETFTVDGLPLVATWGGGNYSPNAVVQVGRLVLRQGNWDGDWLISSDVVREATTHPDGLPGNAALGWWTNRDGDGDRVFSSLPSDAIWGVGDKQQVLLIVPSLDLIMVRFGQAIASGTNEQVMNSYLFTPLMEAVVE
jgi:CubicO group peptidase (beta-lactamase class C family)